jgi:hypothetical protein
VPAVDALHDGRLVASYDGRLLAATTDTVARELCSMSDRRLRVGAIEFGVDSESYDLYIVGTSMASYANHVEAEHATLAWVSYLVRHHPTLIIIITRNTMTVAFTTGVS